MKLILANNQSEQFRQFYKGLQAESAEPFDYAGYSSLLFRFDSPSDSPIEAINLENSKSLSEYDGVYINGYLNTYELAVTVAIACEALGVGYVNRELSSPPSLSKLSMYAKLASKGVPIPLSIAGTKKAITAAQSQLESFTYPAILKRADADRGIDNFKVASLGEVFKLLEPYGARSLWVIQEFIENQGFYLVSFYGDSPAFCIYRQLKDRPDNDKLKAHMYKPRGGANATLVELDKVPKSILETCKTAVRAMNRQIASVDCLYDEVNDRVQVLEVNYNPQLVTIETFKDARVKDFLNNLPKLGQ